MSDEEIRALDRDLEQSRNAFLRAREAQRRLNLNTRDVNRMGANESRPDSITHGVIHTHDVIRLGANGSQSDSTITHDVNHAHDANRPEAQSRLNSNTHDVNRPEAQSRTNLDTQDVPPAPAAARVDESALLSPTTELNTLLAQDRRMRENDSPPPATKMTEHDKMEPEVQSRLKTWTCDLGCGFRHRDFETVAEHEKTCSGTRPVHKESPAAMEAYRRFIREEDTSRGYEGSVKAKMVREDDLAIDAGLPPPFGGSRSDLCYSPGELRAPELTAVPHCTTSHPPVTPPPQKRDRPLLPSSYHPMGSGLADHELAAVGTGGSESNRVSRAAVETVASTHASPSTTCTPELLPHHKMSHLPATPLPQESAQPLSPSTYNTMGDGLVDHEPAVAEDGGSESSHTSEDEIEEFEPWDVSHPPAIPPSQDSAQPLPPSSNNTMGGGLAEHEPAVAATGGSEFRDASKDASKDESEPLTSSQKKRIKRKASKAKRDAEVSQRSGVHTRFPEDGVDQTSVLPVSVNAVS